MKEYTNKGKCKPTEDKKTRKHRNKITLLVICLYVMAVVSLILHIGILILLLPTNMSGHENKVLQH